MPTPDKFVETYDAWKRATDQHHDMMRAVMAGGALDVEAMEQKLAEIDVLHANWMELATSFVPVHTPPGADTTKTKAKPKGKPKT